MNTAYLFQVILSCWFNAITLQNPVAAPGSTVRVFGNEITNCRIGIHAANVPGIKIGVDANDDLFPNEIHFNVGNGFTLTDMHTGIWLQNSPDAVIKVNEIDNDAAITTNEDKLRGIAADNSVNLNICGNEMTNMGYAMRFEGDCNTTRLKNNKMTNYFRGIHFENALFSEQGAAGAPWDNEWVTNNLAIMKVDGYLSIAGGIKWYFRGDETDPNNTFSPSPYNSSIINPDDNESGPVIDCETTLLTNDDFDRDVLFGPVVGDSAEYIHYQDELRYLGREALFRRLNADTTLLSKGSSADSSFRAFYDEMLAANTGRFDSV